MRTVKTTGTTNQSWSCVIEWNVSTGKCHFSCLPSCEIMLLYLDLCWWFLLFCIAKINTRNGL